MNCHVFCWTSDVHWFSNKKNQDPKSTANPTSLEGLKPVTPPFWAAELSVVNGHLCLTHRATYGTCTSPGACWRTEKLHHKTPFSQKHWRPVWRYQNKNSRFFVDNGAISTFCLSSILKKNSKDFWCWICSSVWKPEKQLRCFFHKIWGSQTWLKLLWLHLRHLQNCSFCAARILLKITISPFTSSINIHHQPSSFTRKIRLQSFISFIFHLVGGFNPSEKY